MPFLPEFLYPRSALYMLLVLALALVLDAVYPYHSGVLLSTHPVHTSFILARRLAKPFASRVKGAAIWLAVVLLHLGIYGAILYLAWLASPWIWIVVASWITKCSFSLRLLIDIVERVSVCSARNEWRCVRFWTQQIVRRNVESLDEGHVLSAAIESLAESIVDGFVSPLFYFALLGPLGALLQRIANTLDGTLGFKDPELRDVGWFSAKADTVLNFVPARVTALLYIAMAWIVGSSKNAYTSWRYTASRTESLNAGHPMSAIAGALGVRLEKIGCYTLGIDTRLPEPIDVSRALKLTMMVAFIWIGVMIAVIIIPYLGNL